MAEGSGYAREERIKAASGALRNQFSTLARSIDPLMVAVDLFSKSIIDRSTLEKVQLTSTTDTQKAVLVLTAVSSIVDVNPDVFKTFCEILYSESATKEVSRLLKGNLS